MVHRCHEPHGGHYSGREKRLRTRPRYGAQATGSDAFHQSLPTTQSRYSHHLSRCTCIPLVREKQLAENCDIFCEQGVFTVAQSRRLLQAAQELGLGAKIHADEIVSFGGAELAGEIKALSADHLLHASDTGIRAMAENKVVATLLPLTAFTLRERYARGRDMIDSGCAVALATDLNPGSCCSGSIPLTFALACLYMHLTLEEAITAMTLNGAAALGYAHRTGSIEVGKQGDFVLLDTDNPAVLVYYTGMNSVQHTIKGGRILF